MGYWKRTIDDLNRVLDSTESIARSLAGSKHAREAGDIREGAKVIQAVRDALVVREHDAARNGGPT